MTEFWDLDANGLIAAAATLVSGVAAAVATIVAARATTERKKFASEIADVTNDLNEQVGQYSGALQSGVRWEVSVEGKHTRRLTNVGSASALVQAVEDVSDGNRDTLQVVEATFPATVAPGDFLVLDIERSLASPYIIKGRVKWTEDRFSFSRDFLLT